MSNRAKRVKIVVVGSINMDLVTTSKQFADEGETVMGQSFQTFFGGKGANQAVAASRLGADVYMIGAVGDDDFGRALLENLNHEKVDTQAVKIISNTSSGIASIVVCDTQNQIIVVAGANAKLTPEDIQAQESLISSADVILAQLEVPLDTVGKAAELAKKHHVPFILNPAPAQRLPETLLNNVSILTPNEYELFISLNVEHQSIAETLNQAPCSVVLTQGSKGACFIDTDKKAVFQTAFNVEAVDSTGAGDTFNAALAVYHTHGLAEAVKRASAAGALSVTKMGAQAGMPTETELLTFLEQRS